MEQLQPYIGTIVEALIGLLVAFVLGIVAMLRTKITVWLETRTTAEQRVILHRLAEEAAALVEAQYKDLGGPAKLNKAIDYLSVRAAVYRIKIEPQTIRATIEKAVKDYNAKVKPKGVELRGEVLSSS